MKQKKVKIKMWCVKGHELSESPIHPQNKDQAIKILFNLQHSRTTQMVGFVDESGRQYFVGDVLSSEKVAALNASPNLSCWDHTILARMKYDIEQDSSKHVARVHGQDPIFVLINKGDVVMDPLMNQIFPPVVQQLKSQGRE